MLNIVTCQRDNSELTAPRLQYVNLASRLIGRPNESFQALSRSDTIRNNSDIIAGLYNISYETGDCWTAYVQYNVRPIQWQV